MVRCPQKNKGSWSELWHVVFVVVHLLLGGALSGEQDQPVQWLSGRAATAVAVGLLSWVGVFKLIDWDHGRIEGGKVIFQGYHAVINFMRESHKAG